MPQDFMQYIIGDAGSYLDSRKDDSSICMGQTRSYTFTDAKTRSEYLWLLLLLVQSNITE